MGPARGTTEPEAPAALPRGAAGPGDLHPAREYPPIEGVENGDLTQPDMLAYIDAAMHQESLVGHNINVYDELVSGGIDRIMTQLFNVDRMLKNQRTQTEEDRRVTTYQTSYVFHNVQVGHPSGTTYLTGQCTDLYPSRARLTGISYSGAVTLGSTVTLRAYYEDGHVEEKTAEIPPFQIGGFPIMVGSLRCHTRGATREGLKELGEDPTDPGGYFIAKRGEWVVDLLENICYNKVHIHVRMKPNEVARAEFLSQPGGAFENSSQVRLRYMTNGQLTVEINSTKFEKVRLPFYVVYRLFGMTSDRDVAETIVFDAESADPLAVRMLDILERAFHLADAAFAPLVYELNRERLVQQTAERLAKYLTNPTAYATNESAVQFLNEDLLGSPTKPGGLDKVLLPHLGQTGASRIRKLRFLGLLFYKLLLVAEGVLPPTDRDKYSNKRVHGAGVSLAKAFKTQVNNGVVIPISRALKRELKNNPWSAVTDKTIVDTFRNALSTSDLNRAMEQAITAGNKTIVIRRRAATNRVSSQALERKNELNTLCALRTVVTQNAGNASKQTDRADMMRRSHPSYGGFICAAHSPDTGENVGMRKQLAVTASVCTAGEAAPLKMLLWDDPAVTRLDDVASAEMARRGLARVFVNGEWIGVCESAHELVARYRALRREGRGVDPFATIYHDPVTDEVEFWLDVGRLRRPLLIVDNNIAAYDAALRAAHARAGKYRGYAEEASTFTHDGAAYDLNAALAIVSGRPATAVPVGSLRWLVEPPEAPPEDLARVERADPAVPVLVTRWEGRVVVLDGLHRLQRALDMRLPSLPARFITAEELRFCLPGAPDRVEFTQNVRFTRAHIDGIRAGRITLADLVREGVAEYVTPEEHENCYLAESILDLRAHRHDVTAQFSHCEVEQAIFGLAAHLSPYGDHTQPARVTYETNQGRQTGGWYCLAWPYRTDKNRFFQFYNEVPLVRTLTHTVVPANGANGYIAYASYGGDNQEDSAIICQAAADRGMFAGAFFRFEMAELEKGETFCNPDALTTKNLKPNACYEKLVDGFIRPGSVVRYGDILIGRVARLPRNRTGSDERYLYTDRSIVYRLHEPCVVEAVLKPRGANDELFGIIKLRLERPLRTGDKLSSRSGNKSIVARLLPQSDMPFTESGLTPDLIINTHCIAGETPITTYYGVSRRMDSLPEKGGQSLWGWSSEKCGFVESHQIARMTRGDSEVVRVTLQDGRTLRCTPNHKILTAAEGKYEFVDAGQLTREHRVVMGPEAPLDEPAADEAGWTLQTLDMTASRTIRYTYSFADDIERERALAFARILGLVCTDGTVTETDDACAYTAAVYLGHSLDVEMLLRDVQALTGKIPAASRPAGVWVVHLPSGLARQISSIPGMSVGKKVHARPDWPHFVLDPACPRSLVREFLGGLYGGDGHAPALIAHRAENRKAKSGLTRYGLLGIAFDLTIVDAHKDAMRTKMEKLCALLARVGVLGATVYGPTRRASSQGAADGCPRLQYGVRIPPSTAFATRVGFRYCIQKAARLNAATAYWRYLENVRQHEFVFQRACAHYEDGHKIVDALDNAREDLLCAEAALNQYYSLLTVNVVNNRRRSTGRLATLEKLDYARIEDPENFFKAVGCLEWFIQVGADGARVKTGYVTVTEQDYLAPFALGVVDVRKDGRAITYDLSVPIARTFVANGVCAGNSFPSRMTIGQLIETSVAKVCARRGIIADGTPFLPVDHEAIAQDLYDLGFRYNGRERMYNGMTGEYFDAAIFIGPTMEQRLQKFVLDDEQAVAGSGPTDATTGQPLGGKHLQGGLRLGEMEFWCLESHGSMLNLQRKSSVDSDGRKMHVCRGCGSLAVYNEFQNIYLCKLCGDLADISEVDGSKSAVLMHEELAASCIRVQLGLAPREFEAYQSEPITA